MEELSGGQLAVFVLAVFFGILFRFIGIPALIGQVGVGLLVGFSGLLGSGDIESLRLMGDLGIILLLFLVGLEMNWNDLRRVGKNIILVFLGQTILLIGLFVILGVVGLGYETMTAVLLAVALTFSSTIVVIKMLSEKKNLHSYSGKLSLGILLLQDMLAIFLLAILPSFGKAGGGVEFGRLGVNLVLLFVTVNIVGHAVIKKLLKNIIKNGEDLILFSLAWFFIVVLLAEKVFGVSAEVAGFLAGLSLSSTWGHFQIINKVKTLRDVFLTLFFVVLGIQVGVGSINWWMVVILSLGIMGGKFIITYYWSVMMGIGSRVSFLLAINLTQISEFSLIIMGLGLSAGLWDSETSRTIMVTGLLTMTLSTLLIGSSESIYNIARRKLGLFGGKVGRDYVASSLTNHVILLGCDRTGRSVINLLEKTETPFLVVDFNPDIVFRMKNEGVEVVFADATDPDLVDIANMDKARLIISTIKDKGDSLALLSEIKRRGIVTPIVVDAETIVEAEELYKEGAAYVVMPHFVSGWHVTQLIKKSMVKTDIFEKFRLKQKKALRLKYE